jgi:pyruvate dehydrogenase E2 component (dihydrolipoamide acetyltransferase)
MRITLAADHRVIDGAVAAHFMADLKARLESPVLLLL